MVSSVVNTTASPTLISVLVLETTPAVLMAVIVVSTVGPAVTVSDVADVLPVAVASTLWSSPAVRLES